jgi:tRNA (Thr-GGU) A37 N-methylase
MTINVGLRSIGKARTAEGRFLIEVDRAYRRGLEGLSGFGWVTIVWWASLLPAWKPEDAVLPSPYRGGPAELGVFATRSPCRPNPLCVTAAALVGVDEAEGVLEFGWLDCADGTPILDIKPYQPSADRVESPSLPAWCASWPASVESSAAFDWSRVFSF